ncbi:hypothetical protein PQQ88_01250 [Paraburkholderia caledonica]|uniref:hypothetical protein n=1 Tax=Paraburkholderia caledonica TaxID=134536 RepID=UPI0038B78C48
MGYPGLIQDLGSTTSVQGIYNIKQVLTPAAVGANTTAEQTFSVPGLQVGDSIDINKASHQAGLSIGNVRVSAAGVLAIQFVNTTAGSITPTSEQYIIGGQR